MGAEQVSAGVFILGASTWDSLVKWTDFFLISCCLLCLTNRSEEREDMIIIDHIPETCTWLPFLLIVIKKHLYVTN